MTCRKTTRSTKPVVKLPEAQRPAEKRPEAQRPVLRKINFWTSINIFIQSSLKNQNIHKVYFIYFWIQFENFITYHLSFIY